MSGSSSEVRIPKLCWLIERSIRIESFFFLGREIVQILWKLFSWGGNLSEDFESYSLGKGTCPRSLKGLFSGNEFVWGFWKLFYWEGNLSNDFDSFFCGKGNSVQTFLGQRKFFSWLRKSKLELNLAFWEAYNLLPDIELNYELNMMTCQF
jgi:hypothetical protein